MADIELKSLKFSEDGDVYYPLPIVNTSNTGQVLAVDHKGNWVSASPSTDMGIVNLAYLQSKFDELVDQHRLVPPAKVTDEGNVLTINSKGIPQWTAITNAEEVAY